MIREMREFQCVELKLGECTQFDKLVLTLGSKHLQASMIERDDRIMDVQFEILSPGDSARLLCVKDVIEPRTAIQVGQGHEVIHVLKNLAVVTCGPIIGFQEGIIDMCGPGAKYSPFSSMQLLVLQIKVRSGLTPHQHEEVVRNAGLRAAQYLANLTADATPEKIEQLDWDASPVAPTLPRIAYLYMVLSQGLLHDTYVLGRDAKEHLPLIIDPRDVLNTRVVSGNCVSACDKNTTFHHQNNSVIGELLRGHGERWNFVGIVITNEPTRLGEKQHSAQAAVQLVRYLEAQGAVVTKEGFGNPDADLMMVLRELEQSGIKCVAITDEYAGVDGDSQSLADTTLEANAIVSVGNANQRITLPKVQRTIGPIPDVSRLAGGYPHSVREDGSMEVELQAMIGATNQFGFGRLSCREV